MINLEWVPCSLEKINKLLESQKAFKDTYRLSVVDGYLPFEGALEYSLNSIEHEQVWHPWLPYLFVFPPDRAVIGLRVFKGVPDSKGTVEMGYAIAPKYQKGEAT